MGKLAKLYKYRALGGASAEFTLDILANDRIWFAAPSSFNDPFDCKLPVPTQFSPETWKALLPRLFPGTGIDLSDWNPQSDPPEKLKALVDLLATLTHAPRGASFDEVLSFMARGLVARAAAQVDEAAGVLSLSALPDNMLMWSHYADCHRGICLELDVDAARLPRLSPVHYANDNPGFDEAVEAIALHQWNAERPGLLADMAYKVIANDLDRSSIYYWTGQWLYAKSADWSYEQEWRSVLDRSGHFEFPAEALTGVIIGCSVRDESIDLLDQAFKRRQRTPAIYRARRKNGVFGLDIVEV